MRVMLLREAAIQSTSCHRNETGTTDEAIPSEIGGGGAASLDSNIDCPERELIFGLIYTAGSWANQAGRLPAGILLDHAGPRVTATLSALIMTAGALTYGLATTSVGGLVCGYLLLGLGGAGVQISVQSTAALFPRNRSLAMSCMSGAYQFATGVLIVFEAIHRPAAGAPPDAPPRLSLSWLMTIYAIIGGVLAVLSLTIWPDAPFTSPPAGAHADAPSWEEAADDAQPRGGARGGASRDMEAGTPPKGAPAAPGGRSTNADDRYSSEVGTAVLAPPEDGAARLFRGGSGCNEVASVSADAVTLSPARISSSHKAGDAAAAPVGLLRTRGFREQVTSVEFGLMLAWFAVNMLQCQYTVGTIGLQFELKGDADRSVTSFFGTALSLAFVVAPCVGAAIDVVGFGLVMAIITLALILTNSLLLFTPLAIAYPASLIYAAGRVSLWATFFSYCGAVFGFVHYGKVVGIAMLLASCFSLLQYPLLDLALSAPGSAPVDSLPPGATQPFADFTIPNSLFVGLASASLLTIPRLARAPGAKLERREPKQACKR